MRPCEGRAVRWLVLACLLFFVPAAGCRHCPRPVTAPGWQSWNPSWPDTHVWIDIGADGRIQNVLPPQVRRGSTVTIRVGQGAERYEVKVTGCRASPIVFTMKPDGVEDIDHCNGEGGIDVWAHAYPVGGGGAPGDPTTTTSSNNSIVTTPAYHLSLAVAGALRQDRLLPALTLGSYLGGFAPNQDGQKWWRRVVLAAGFVHYEDHLGVSGVLAAEVGTGVQVMGGYQFWHGQFGGSFKDSAWLGIGIDYLIFHSVLGW